MITCVLCLEVLVTTIIAWIGNWGSYTDLYRSQRVLIYDAEAFLMNCYISIRKGTEQNIAVWDWLKLYFQTIAGQQDSYA